MYSCHLSTWSTDMKLKQCKHQCVHVMRLKTQLCEKHKTSFVHLEIRAWAPFVYVPNGCKSTRLLITFAF